MLRCRRLSVISLILVALFGGCAQKLWYKQGAGQSALQIEKGDCLASAYSKVPAALATATIGSGYITPSYTTCSGYGFSASCVTTGGQYVPPTTIPYDANAGTRNQVFKGCMYSKGWSLLTRKQIRQIGK